MGWEWRKLEPEKWGSILMMMMIMGRWRVVFIPIKLLP